MGPFYQPLTLWVLRATTHKLDVRMPTLQQVLNHLIDKFPPVIRVQDSWHTKIWENIGVESIGYIYCAFALYAIGEIEFLTNGLPHEGSTSSSRLVNDACQ